MDDIVVRARMTHRCAGILPPATPPPPFSPLVPPSGSTSRTAEEEEEVGQAVQAALVPAEEHLDRS